MARNVKYLIKMSIYKQVCLIKSYFSTKSKRLKQENLLDKNFKKII